MIPPSLTKTKENTKNNKYINPQRIQQQDFNHKDSSYAHRNDKLYTLISNTTYG